MALVSAGITTELRELLLKDKPAHMLEISPKGTVPVLLTAEGILLDESLDVMLWALRQSDPHSWLLDEPASMEWISINDDQFKPLLDAYKYADRHPPLTLEEHRENTLHHLDTLNQQLQDTPWLLGDCMRLADAALMPFIRQYAMVDKNWFDQQPWPGVQRWLSVLLEHPCFTRSMPQFKLYNSGHRYWFPEGSDTGQVTFD
jgi:glutathione S-transferase